ncbi:phosphodiester glycosidase family protein [bacterium]|nr:phosphodiester glycosidase family protein [bacterium]
MRNIHRTQRSEHPLLRLFMRSLLCCTLLPLFVQAAEQNEAASPPNRSSNPAVRWTRVGTGVEIGIVSLESGLFPGELTLVRTSLSSFRPRVVRASSFQRRKLKSLTFAERTGASLCINANFFDTKGLPLGLVVSRGVEHRAMHRGGSLLNGVLRVHRDQLTISSREEAPHERGLEAVQAGPMLVSGGRSLGRQLDGGSLSRRSGICLISPKEFLLFATSSSFRGATLRELADLLSSPAIGCQEALNFDGGGSTQLYMTSDIPSARPGFGGIDIVGRDEVPTALCLFPLKS